MRRTAFGSILCVVILAAPVIAVAGISLGSMMESWNSQRHRIEAMLGGRRPYDEAALHQALSLYINDASRVARAIPGNSAEARDLAQRFAGFAADGQRALGSIGQPEAFRARFDQMVSDCQSCHAAYN